MLTELLVVGGLALVAWALVSYFLWSDIYRHNDTAALVAMTEATGRYGVPYNPISISSIEADSLKPLPAPLACAAPLAPGPESYPNGQFNHLEYHAYYFVYLLAPLTWFAPAEAVIAVTQALAVIATVGLVYMILRLEGVGVLGRALFCAAVIAYPVVNNSLASVYDLYMDRYFPPLALLYLALLYYGLVARRRGWSKAWLWALPVGIAAAATNDRSIVYVMGANAAFLLLMGRRALGEQRRAALVLCAFSVGLGAVLLAYLKWVHTSDWNTMGDFVGRVSELTALFSSAAPFRFGQSYAELSLKLLVMNAVLFGIWGFWRFKLMLVALAAILPNVLTTIGGAEKVSWGFHYHADYLPFVVFAAALGFGAAWRTARTPIGHAALAAGLVLGGAAMLSFNAEQPGWVFDGSASAESGLVEMIQYFADRPDSAVAYRRSLYKELDGVIPKGATVTSIQDYSGILAPGRQWYFYPVGIDSAEYAVLPAARTVDGVTYYAAAEGFRSDLDQLNQCLTQRLARDGYNVDSPRMVGPIAVLRRAF